MPDLFEFYSSDGILPVQEANQGSGIWGLL